MGYGVGNEQREIFASATRSADVNSVPQLNQNHRGVHVIVDVTAVPGVDTVTFTIQGQDSVSGEWYDILASTAISATGTTVLRVYPGLTEAANEVESDFLPAIWRVSVDHSAATDFDYSVGANLEV